MKMEKLNKIQDLKKLKDSDKIKNLSRINFLEKIKGLENVKDLNKMVFPAMVVLMIAAIGIVFMLVNSQSQVKMKEPVYQFFMEQKAEYDKNVKVIENERGVIFKEDGKKSAGDISPIYTSDSKALYLAEEMYWVDTEGDREWRVPAFSRLEMDKKGVIWYVSGKNKTRMSSGFLYNGRGTCIFLEPAEVVLKGHAYKADAFSFYSSAAGLFRLYIYGEDTIEFAEEVTSNTTANGKSGYMADFTTGLYTAPNGVQRLLVSSPELLKSIEER